MQLVSAHHDVTWGRSKHEHTPSQPRFKPYTATASAEGRFEFTTYGNNFDTTLGAVTGSCGDPLVIRNDDDNICFDESVQSHITLNVEQSDVIIVLLGGFEDAEGDAVLNINAL
ncbi:MAG: hypothetical protein Tsb0020_36360 [Haliangiales bacterium]